MKDMYCMKCMRPNGGTEMCPYCGYVAGENEIPPHVLRPGTLLMGQYLLGEPLGQGGFGITYIARDLKLNMRVAIKEYFPCGYAIRNVETSERITVTDERLRLDLRQGKDSFLKEAQTLARFKGVIGIVDVLNFFEANDTAYIVMEFLEGETLSSRLKRQLFTADQIFRLMEPVFDALEQIHREDVVHRDVSPDNIMLLPDGRLKLMDFGAARLMNYQDQRSVSVVLKAGYAPLEQYSVKGEQGPWTDVYALSAAIYKCITGKTPADAHDRLMGEAIQWPSELGIPISAQQEAALKKGLAVLQKDRFRSVGEFRSALKRPVNRSAEAVPFGRGPMTYPSPDRRMNGPAGIAGGGAASALGNGPAAPSPNVIAGELKVKPEPKNAARSRANSGRTKLVLALGLSGGFLIVVLAVVLGLLVLRRKADDRRAAQALVPTVSPQALAPTLIPETATPEPTPAPEPTPMPTPAPTPAPTATATPAPKVRQRPSIGEVGDTIAASMYHTVAIRPDGTVTALGWDGYGQCFVSYWTDVVSVAAGSYHTVGLKADGRVVATVSEDWQGSYGYRNNFGQSDVSGWKDIVAISAGAVHTVGLRSDGTVVAVGGEENGRLNVTGWRNIVAVAAGYKHTVGLQENGTVVAAGDNGYKQCNVSGWTDIIAIAAGGSHTVGLKADGTVVAVGANNYGQCNVSGWTDIVAVAAGNVHTVGLKADGTVVAVGSNSYGQCGVSGWTDIVFIAVGHDHTLGLKADGTVAAVGWNNYGQCNVSSWRNIRVPQR